MNVYPIHNWFVVVCLGMHKTYAVLRAFFTHLLYYIIIIIIIIIFITYYYYQLFFIYYFIITTIQRILK